MISGKSKRLKLTAARRTKMANDVTLLGADVVTNSAHDFRMKGGTSVEGSAALYTVFHTREAQYEINKRINKSNEPLMKQSEVVVPASMYKDVVNMPLRPKWTAKMKADEIQRHEEEVFENTLQSIYDRFPPERLNHFEHNIMVWRQLWRVCEKSSVLCLVLDARHPLFHFPPSLYNYVVTLLKKPLILVLNKIDLIPAATVDAWLAYFHTNYPGCQVVPFTSFPNKETVTLEGVDFNQSKNTHVDNRWKRSPVGVDNLKSVLREMGYDWQKQNEAVNEANAASTVLSGNAQGNPSTEEAGVEQTVAGADKTQAATTTAQAGENATEQEEEDEEEEDEGEEEDETPGPTSRFAFLQINSDEEEEEAEEEEVVVRPVVKVPAAKRSDPQTRKPAAVSGKDVVVKPTPVVVASQQTGGGNKEHGGAVGNKGSSSVPVVPQGKATGPKGEEQEGAKDKQNGKSGINHRKRDKHKKQYKHHRQDDLDDEGLDEVEVDGGVHVATLPPKLLGTAVEDVEALEKELERLPEDDPLRFKYKYKFQGWVRPEDEKLAAREEFEDMRDELIDEERRKARERKDKEAKMKETLVTIGMIGHPNSGKSSIINALLGFQATSVSDTPGRTKHLQTLVVADGFQVCDCPGLVFPAADVPKALQVLCGVFPLPQVTEFYSSIQFLGQYVSLPQIYKLKPPANKGDVGYMEDDLFASLKGVNVSVPDDQYPWSAMEVCEAVAAAHQYKVKGSKGRPDTHRAAAEIIGDAVVGKIVLSFLPPKQEREEVAGILSQMANNPLFDYPA